MVLGTRCPDDNYWANKRKNGSDWRCPKCGKEFAATGIEVSVEDGLKIF